MQQGSHTLPLVLILLAVLYALCAFARPDKRHEEVQGPRKYIVYMGHHGGMEPHDLTSLHHDILSGVTGSKESARKSLVHSYKRSFSGFSAHLTQEQAESIAEHPRVVSVFKSRKYQLHTTRSWDFVGLGQTKLSQLIANKTSTNDVIVGVVDTGVWPESKSFNDEGMPPVPKKWKGVCDNSQVTDASHTFHCNRRLIGARFYMSEKYRNARDEVGHGTHTASTIAGSLVKDESLFGLAKGDVRGGFPGARLAIYKVCSIDSCEEDGILAAFDDAIQDGVDILSLSLGGWAESFDEDAMAVGAFHAMERGILVACSAGNAGPDLYSVTNVAPWIFTVGASTIDRDFPLDIKLGDKTLQGRGLNLKDIGSSKVISGEDAAYYTRKKAEARFCAGKSLDPNKVKGNVVACQHTPGLVEIDVIEDKMIRMGAAGFLLVQSTKSQSFPKFFRLPGAAVTPEQMDQILLYTNSTNNATVTISASRTVVGSTVPAPAIATFSSRGPAHFNMDVLKPDIIGPGVYILAAWSKRVNYLGEPILSDYHMISGTSMSCPHIAAAAALVKAAHPEWSPAAIKSALMTTATFLDNTKSPIKGENDTNATPLELGAGHINPVAALTPGLVYDISPNDYVLYLCSKNYSRQRLELMTENQNVSCSSDRPPVSDLNYPTITVVDYSMSAKVTRTVTNVGDANSVYKVSVTAPPGISVSVVPSELKFNHLLRKLKFEVTFRGNGTATDEDWVFGDLTWKSRDTSVRSVFMLSFPSADDETS